MNNLFLGIDTSNYKTSVAVVDGSGHVIYERSEFLEVSHGQRGLRQSEAFFLHSNRLPLFIEEMASSVDVSNICAAGVSSRPRRVEGSYMPCFLAGMNAAREITSVLGIPYFEFSHQEGHAAAILEEPGMDPVDPALFFHLSGGTTEFLLCSKDEKGYEMEICGGTDDISIGQLIDRTGVAMGMPFPSGPYLDEIAMNYSGTYGPVLSRIKLKDGHFNLSGTETQIMKILASGDVSDALIRELFDKIASVLTGSAGILADKYGIGTVYMAGGVASSSYIRTVITNQSHGISIIFGKPGLSGDNAVGTARLAARSYFSE